MERIAFVQANGDVQEVLALELRNDGDSEFPLDGWVGFVVTETENRVELVCDDGNCTPPWEAGVLELGRYQVGSHLKGGIPPKGRRLFAVRMLRRSLADVSNGGISFADPALGVDLTFLGISRIRIRATVVFPADHIRRDVLASDAVHTSRMASWEFESAGDVPRHLRAKAVRALLPSAPQRLDDAIAELQRLLAAHVVGESVKFEQLQRNLREARLPVEMLDRVDLVLSVFDGFGFDAREAHLRELLSELAGARARVLADNPFPAVASGVETTSEWLARSIEREALGLELASRLPADAWTALVTLMHYQAAQRKAPHKWSPRLSEKGFQEQLHQFLEARGGLVEREVQTAKGRIDFLLGSMPVELKVRDLGGESLGQVDANLQQAAEYASSRGSGLGCLLILDKHRHMDGGKHLAQEKEQIQVRRVTSKEGIGGTSVTLVVALVVVAFPPTPSRLGRR
ncbi:hypothetical protein LZ198_23760 [Myxococcus sp. K15C18031901]|uniref:hypothetical protein n=1 Tax=Myxococcus dinghuensis TaxID=2906761 RepID=UPI0020A7318D|nr:hypothetical protein [Myxococcus dinghuensis]MCP3101896.1 hypothetical protein [Myxococcus dinghuensis]